MTFHLITSPVIYSLEFYFWTKLLREKKQEMFQTNLSHFLNGKVTNLYSEHSVANRHSCQYLALQFLMFLFLLNLFSLYFSVTVHSYFSLTLLCLLHTTNKVRTCHIIFIPVWFYKVIFSYLLLLVMKIWRFEYTSKSIVDFQNIYCNVWQLIKAKLRNVNKWIFS